MYLKFCFSEVVFPNQSFSVNKVHEINETDYGMYAFGLLLR